MDLATEHSSSLLYSRDSATTSHNNANITSTSTTTPARNYDHLRDYSTEIRSGIARGSGLAADLERPSYMTSSSYSRDNKDSALASTSTTRFYDKYGLDRHSASTSATAISNWLDDFPSSNRRTKTDTGGGSSILAKRSTTTANDTSYHGLSSYNSTSALDFDSESSPFKRVNTRTTTTTSSGGLYSASFDHHNREDPLGNSSAATTMDKYTPSYRDYKSYLPPSSNPNTTSSALDFELSKPSISATNGRGFTLDVQPTSSSKLGTANFAPTSILHQPSVPRSYNTTREMPTSSIGLTGSGLMPSAAGSRAQSSLGGCGGGGVLQQLFDDMRQIEETVDSIEIPARGRCKVFMAKYGYDPYKQSPNENPDNELAFNAGDYIMVFDDIDEDGYFIGEMLDGRRGYVPSNWLDRVTGDDLFEFQASTLFKPTKDEETESNNFPPEFYDAIVSDSLQHSNFQHLVAPEDYRRMNDYVNLDDVDEVDDECLSDYERAEAEQMRKAVPPPMKLQLERQLIKSILISWLHPEAARGTIISYQVYVDGVLKSTVPSGDRTKALIEGVDSSIPHRISVRAIDLSGRHSNDAGCTIVIGQNVPFAPACVKASHVTSDSALISWLPCNSNFHHVIAVNSVEVQTVRPGVYKHLINGLSANTLYRVWVRAKPGKILSIDEKDPKKLESLTTFVDFKTMPKSLPDPPVNVQVEAGPQRRTLLVTWLPLTLNNFGSSNGCPVTGYAVFAGHKKLADIDSPTGDHALLDLTDLESLHKKAVTVRTKSGENLSQDSMSCQIPDEYLKSTGPKLNDNNHMTMSHHHSQSHGHGHHHYHLQGSASNRHKVTSDAHARVASDGHVSYGQHSPQRHPARHSSSEHKSMTAHLSPRGHSSLNRPTVMARGRQMARSLQNLESDLDSRRSSIPAIEITRDPNRPDPANYTESYSEEEFENSMRFRGGKTGRGGSRYTRGRRYHSMDGATRYGINSRMRVNTPLDTNVRYFVALFDYDPSTMSPNPNAANEELGFKEGSIIKIIGDKGPDGFYRGELDGYIGFVPGNVVSEITDQAILYNLHQKDMLKRQHQPPTQQQMAQTNPQMAFTSNPQQQPPLQPRLPAQMNEFDMQAKQQIPQQQQQQGQGVKRMIALYDYNPQDSSPNMDTESEIPFKTGDVIHVYGKMDADGYYLGQNERTLQQGLVPSNFLKEEPLQGKPPSMIQQDQMMNQANSGMGMSQQGQFIGNQMGGQQPGAMGPGGMMDSFGQQQQQGLNSMNNQQIRGANVRPPMMPGQQNINRPTSLSLGSGFNSQLGANQPNDWGSNTRQQLQGMNQMQDGQSNQMLQQQPNQMMGNQQQTNQQQQGGVLSNLLSSGKQIINAAAATPRGSNQPAQFPNMNQQGNVGMGMGSMNMGNPNMGMNQMCMTDPSMNNPGLPRPNMMQQGNQMTSSNMMQQQPMQQQQQGQFNQMAGGFNQRGGLLNHQQGDDQGGNILNTMKNIFKL